MTIDLGKHDCVWTVVQIKSLPVAVFCKVCDKTLPVGKEEPVEFRPVVPQGYFSPTTGCVYTINSLNGISQTAVIHSVDWRSSYNGGSEMQVTFKLN